MEILVETYVNDALNGSQTVTVADGATIATARDAYNALGGEQIPDNAVSIIIRGESQTAYSEFVKVQKGDIVAFYWYQPPAW